MERSRAVYKMNQGRLTAKRGCVETDYQRFTLYAWDATPICLGARCPVFALCHYETKQRVEQEGATIKCTVMVNYLKGCIDVVMDNFGDKLDEGTMFRVGMHLIPLYKILCRLKIEELAVERGVSVSARGMVQISPIYREMRETIKTIDAMWEKLGLTLTPTSRAMPNTVDLGGGVEGSYYDKMEAEAMAEFEKKGTTKGKLVRREK